MAFEKLAVDKSHGPYVLQLVVYMQGTKPASREFNILLAHLLAQIDIYIYIRPRLMLESL